MTEYRYTYRRGGVDYLLRAVFDGGRYKGSWTCLVCKVTKEPPREFTGELDAVGRLQEIVLTEHHFPVHVIIGGGGPG